jgi:hypothetical protein
MKKLAYLLLNYKQKTLYRSLYRLHIPFYS